MTTLRVRKYDEARRALFEAAMALFREKGFEQTSVDDIAGRAGFSRATFFNHFGNKTAVFRFYGQQVAARIEAVLAEADARRPPLDRLRQMLGALAAEAAANREDLRLVFLHSVRDPAYLEAPTAPRERVLELVAGLLGEAQRLGQAREDMAAGDLAGHVMGLYQNALVGIVFAGREPEAAVDSIWRFVWGGLSVVRPCAQ